MTEEVYCTDCAHMYWIDPDTMEEMDCWNHAALPENGAPEIISSEPHNCPYYEPRGDVIISKRLLEIIKYKLITVNGLTFTDDNRIVNVDCSYILKEIDEVLE